jgi:hypothetical protein
MNLSSKSHGLMKDFSKLLAQRIEARLQWLQDLSQILLSGNNLNKTLKPIDILGTKQRISERQN